jgi:hypothetical protein
VVNEAGIVKRLRMIWTLVQLVQARAVWEVAVLRLYKYEIILKLT